MGPELEMQLKAVVDSIVKPSKLAGSRHMEEVVVKLGALIRAQKSSLDPGLLTGDMQVCILKLYPLINVETKVPFCSRS